MKKTTTLILLLLCNSIALFAQVDAPSKLPSERLDSEFFTDDTDSYIGSQRVTLVNQAGNDSPALQAQINSLSNLGGGVIIIPAGTWELGEIVLLSNVHLMFAENAIIEPVLSTKTNKSIFIIGFNGANISNVSIRSISGQFTLDLSKIDYNLRVLPFNIKEVENFMISGCHVIDKRTVHSTVNCGVSKRNGVWAGAKQGLVKDITVEHAHDGYGAVQVRVGERLHFKNIISLSGGATLRIETDAHESSGGQAPIEITRISEISGYNIKCNEGNAAVMIQPWGVTNGWFDVEKIEATSCMASVRVDRAFVDVNDEHIGSFDPDSRITDVTSVYGTKAHIKDGNFKSVPCHLRSQISKTSVEGTGNRFFEGPTIAPILYNASSTGVHDPRYYKVNIPSENELISKSSNFPENSLIVSRWSNTSTNCNSSSDFIHVTDFTVSPSELNIEVNATENLTQTIIPSNATNQGVSWVSSKASVAQVDQWGAITGISEGETIITVNTTDGNKVKEVKVTVEKNLSIEGIAPHKNQISVYPNPTTNQEDIVVDLPSQTSNVFVSIYSVQGELVFSKNYSESSDEIIIKTSSINLNSGLYLVKLHCDNLSFSSKLMISEF